jgi:surface protein
MFRWSKFTGNISDWDVSNVVNMCSMFECSVFNGDISGWDVSHVIDMSSLFYYSKFTKNLYNWNINPICKTDNMFVGCAIKDEYRPKLLRIFYESFDFSSVKK